MSTKTAWQPRTDQPVASAAVIDRRVSLATHGEDSAIGPQDCGTCFKEPPIRQCVDSTTCADPRTGLGIVELRVGGIARVVANQSEDEIGVAIDRQHLAVRQQCPSLLII